MNEIEKRKFSAVGSVESNPFLEYANAQSNRMIVGHLLKFTKGKFFAGQDNKMVPEGTQLIANMDELLVGWVRWEGNRPVQYEMEQLVKGIKAKPRKDLGYTDSEEWEDGPDGHPRDPWQFANYLLLKATSKDGQLYTFTASSKGGLDALGLLSREYGTVYRQRPDEYPTVELGAGGYEHPVRSRGWIDTPSFKIIGWAPKSVFAVDEEAYEIQTPFSDEKAKPKPSGKGRF
jgi:hypothetical protein